MEDKKCVIECMKTVLSSSIALFLVHHIYLFLLAKLLRLFDFANPEMLLNMILYAPDEIDAHKDV